MCDLHQGEEAEHGVRTGLSELVDELVVAATNARIYWSDHPRVKSSLHRLAVGLRTLFARSDEERLVLGAAEGCLFHDGRPLVGASATAPRILRRLEELSSGGIAFERTAGEQDLSGLVLLLSLTRTEATGVEQANRALEASGCRAIRLLPGYRRDAEPDGPRAGDAPAPEPSPGPSLVRGLEAPLQLYKGTVELLQDAIVRAAHGDALDLDDARGRVQSILRRLTEDAPAMRAITRYERYDAYTFGHSIRVCTLALAFARELFDDEHTVMRVGLAALLHDIGKAKVPFDVLHSTRRLSPEERVEMNRHTEHGARILLELPDVDPLLVAVAFGHHRTRRGGGYPASLRAPQSLGTRIVKICDVYEALTAVRPYKARMTPLEAYRVMLAMDDHFDPALLRSFVELNGLWPAGTEVWLSDGARATVVGQTGDLLRPEVTREGAEGSVDLRREAGVEVVGEVEAPSPPTRVAA